MPIADRWIVLNRRSVIVLCVAAGVGLEMVIHAMSGRREAWDSGLYWTLGLPIVAVLSLAMGWASQRSDWLWTFLIVPSQVTTMMMRSREIGSLWPLAAALSSILSTPFVAAAFVGSRLRPPSLR